MGDRNFRLDAAFRPTRYVARLAPDMAARTFRASGHVDLVLDRPARALVLHAVGIEVQRSTLVCGTRRIAAAPTPDADSQTLTFALEHEAPAGPATLDVEWTGVFHDDLRGLYMAGVVAVTQFEAADARRLLPCFDEPSFKAIWSLSVEAPAGLAVVGNGRVASDTVEDGRRVVVFEPTPPISSYLVALVVGRLQPSPELVSRGVPVRTWSVPEKAHLAGFAQEIAGAVLPLLEDYFDRAYPFTKLDQVGIPDFEAGAMENAGCITFREVALLADRAKAPLSVQKRISEVVTHELAHQWFGNLVTMKWWDDLWLNEAFATWMAYKIVDLWMPGWRVWDGFEAGKAEALHLDSMESTHPIRSEVRNADEATENFDVITYEKGGAMLRMIEGWLGEETFRAGIRDYVRRHEWGNAAAADLWGALARASSQPVGEVADAWTTRSGYPLVCVERRGARVALSQRRFLQAADDDGLPETRPVPVVLRWADDTGVRETRHLLRGTRETLDLPARGDVRFACANRAGAGFYRVQYADEERAALARHAAQLAPVERMNLVADAWALFRTGAGTLASVLDLVVGLAGDTDYAVLGELVGRLEAMERRFLVDADRPAFARIVYGLFAPHFAKTGWDAAPGEDDPARLRRAVVLRALALVARRPEFAREARARLERFWAGDAAALDANLLDPAALCAARAGDAALFDRMAERSRTDPDPAAKRRMLACLASFESPAILGRSVELLLADTVPTQDSSIYFGALVANRAAQGPAFDFVRARWADVRRKTAAPMLARRLVESLGELTTRRVEVEALFDAQAESLSAVPAAVRQTRERLRLDESVRARAMPELSAWLRSRR